MGLLKRIGRIAKKAAPGIARIAGTAIGGPALGAAAGAGARAAIGSARQRVTQALQPVIGAPMMAAFASGQPISGLVPPPMMPPPPPPNLTPPPPPPGTRPPGPIVQVNNVPGNVVAVAFAPAIISRLAQAFSRWSTGLGAFISIDAVMELFQQPFSSWPGDALGYFQSFMNSEGQQILGGSGMKGLDALMPQDIILPPIIDTIHRAPKNYVIVEKDGQKVAMLKVIAQKFGFWKPSAKPPISATEYRQAKAAGRVANKVERLAKTLDTKPLKVSRTTSCRKR